MLLYRVLRAPSVGAARDTYIYRAPGIEEMSACRHPVGPRPYHVGYTGSRPITEVKRRRARLVLGWVTAWEHRVPPALAFLIYFCANRIREAPSRL